MSAELVASTDINAIRYTGLEHETTQGLLIIVQAIEPDEKTLLISNVKRTVGFKRIIPPPVLPDEIVVATNNLYAESTTMDSTQFLGKHDEIVRRTEMWARGLHRENWQKEFVGEPLYEEAGIGDPIISFDYDFSGDSEGISNKVETEIDGEMLEGQRFKVYDFGNGGYQIDFCGEDSVSVLDFCLTAMSVVVPVRTPAHKVVRLVTALADTSRVVANLGGRSGKIAKNGLLSNPNAFEDLKREAFFIPRLLFGDGAAL